MGLIDTLLTPRLILEPLAMRHAESYERNFVDYEVIRHLSAAVPWPYPEGGVADYISTVIEPRQGEGHWHWALALRDAPEEVIGSVGLWRKGTPEHRGFWLARAHWGKGLMSEATHAVNDHAFDVLGFEELLLSNALGNERSRNVKARRGAELIGTREMTFVDPVYTQTETWRLTKAHWLTWRKDRDVASSQRDRP